MKNKGTKITICHNNKCKGYNSFTACLDTQAKGDCSPSLEARQK